MRDVVVLQRPDQAAIYGPADLYMVPNDYVSKVITTDSVPDDAVMHAVTMTSRHVIVFVSRNHLLSCRAPAKITSVVVCCACCVRHKV